MTRRAVRSWLRALKRWTPGPANYLRVLFGENYAGPHGGRASW